MPGNLDSKPWKLIGAVAIVAAISATLWWANAHSAEAGIDTPVICTRCQSESTAKVGDTPGDEEWPRICAKCGQKGIYLFLRCNACGKTFPLKDPGAERFGYPSQCPHCKQPEARGT